MRAMSAGDLRGDVDKIMNFHVLGFISVATQTKPSLATGCHSHIQLRSACTELYA